MKKINLKRIVLTLFFVLTLALAIPSFNINIGGKQIDFSGINFVNIGLNANYPSLRRGQGIFVSNRHSSEINFGLKEDGTEYTNDEKRGIAGSLQESIKERILFTGLQDIEVTYSRDAANKFYIELLIPEYYSDQAQYVSRITNDGSVSFLQFTGSQETDDFGILPIEVPDYVIDEVRIASTIVFPPNAQANGGSINLPHLNLVIDGKVAETFGNVPTISVEAIQSGNASFRMNIGADLYALFTAQNVDTLETNELIAIPAGSLQGGTEQDIYNFLKLTQAYFKDKPLEFTLTPTDTITSVAPRFNTEGASIVAVTFLLGLIFIEILILRNFGLRRTLLHVLATSSTVLISLLLLKMLQVPLSSGLVMGYLVALPLISFIFVQTEKSTVFLSKKYSYTTKFILFFMPIFSYITILMIEGIVANVTSVSSVLFYVVFMAIVFSILMMFYKNQPDVFNKLSLGLVIVLSFLVALPLEKGMINDLYLTTLIILMGLSFTINFIYRSLRSELRIS